MINNHTATNSLKVAKKKNPKCEFCPTKIRLTMEDRGQTMSFENQRVVACKMMNGTFRYSHRRCIERWLIQERRRLHALGYGRRKL